ncbi:hypothetical protein QUF50_01490 [Thiotrichales bacterium HSG1]|nr:hypothetical protein [Thiotrichales bacterium HSG1]
MLLFKKNILIIILLLTVNTVYSGELDYKNRGDRWEGIAPHPVAGADIELLSALVQHREKWQPLPNKCKVKFYLPDATEVNLKVQELRPRHFYKMDRVIPKPIWKQGVNYFEWSTNEVIEPLHLNIAKLGAVARLQSTKRKAEYVAPVLIYHDSIPTNVNGYRFAFKVGGNAKLNYAIYQEDSRKLVIEQELGKQSVGTPFIISWNSNKATVGAYKLVVIVTFLCLYTIKTIYIKKDILYSFDNRIKFMTKPLNITF